MLNSYILAFMFRIFALDAELDVTISGGRSRHSAR